MVATLKELARISGSEVHGDGECELEGVDTLQDAVAGKISFCANSRYRRYLATTKASAVILRGDDLAACRTNALVSDNPYLVYARVAAHLHPLPVFRPGIAPSAAVDPTADVDESAFVGPNATVDSGVVIESGAYVGPNCVVGADAVIGRQSRLVANVTLCHGTRIGARCILHPGVVVGSDGFGMANDSGTWVKVPQLGRVVLGDDVDVGANTTIDRGAIHDTLIADGVKLDNLIQVAHNVEIGADTAIAACTGISGSTKVGRRCTLAGAVGVVGHIEIADNVHVSGMTMVSRSLRKSGVYTGSIPAMSHDQWKKNFARLKQLDDMARRLRALEAAFAVAEKSHNRHE